MSIKLQLSKLQLGSLVYCLQQLPKIPAQTRQTKVAISVLSDLSQKFEKKMVTESYKPPTLFTKKKVKKISFTLKIFEAHYLEVYVNMMESHPLNEYDRNVLLYIKSNLNQALA
jgi:hypothetical protein